jgi:hypothetical protein
MRAPLIIVVIVAISATGCSQGAPTAPSSAAPAAAVSSSPIVTESPTPPPIEPLVARLTLVTNHLVSANHQLDLYLLPNPPPIVPPDPIHLGNALDFYLKANEVLGAISGPSPPPIVPEWTDALNGIIEQANTTLSRLHADCDACSPSPPPIFQDLIAQANRTKSLATALSPDPPPI